ncbi:hypothetical protein HYX18_00645 [Candidatus Woesearchaeota archaeon]|nr:hypothetical protein [Candidatus Woesearchaeota archaeon]
MLQLKKRFEQLQKQNDSLLGQINGYKTQTQSLQQSNKEFKSEIEKLREQAEKAPEIEFPKFSPRLEKLQSTNKQLTEQLDRYKEQIQKLGQANKEFRVQIEKNYKNSLLSTPN